MEIKINREIREYTEAMYFGLSLRQFLCAVLACGVAVGLYFLLRPHMGMETVSWVCILGRSHLQSLDLSNITECLQKSFYGYGSKVRS